MNKEVQEVSDLKDKIIAELKEIIRIQERNMELVVEMLKSMTSNHQ